MSLYQEETSLNGNLAQKLSRWYQYTVRDTQSVLFPCLFVNIYISLSIFIFLSKLALLSWWAMNACWRGLWPFYFHHSIKHHREQFTVTCLFHFQFKTWSLNSRQITRTEEVLGQYKTHVNECKLGMKMWHVSGLRHNERQRQLSRRHANCDDPEINASIFMNTYIMYIKSIYLLLLIILIVIYIHIHIMILYSCYYISLVILQYNNKFLWLLKHVFHFFMKIVW
jgi:hypothetical protein